MSDERRADGQGTVGRLPSGRWRFRVKKPGGGYASGTFDTEVEADGARRALLAAIAAVTPMVAPGMVTLGSFMRRWLDDREKEGLRGVRSERSAFECRIAPHVMASLPMKSITRSMVRNWIAEQRTSTVKHRRAGKPPTDTGKILDVGSLRRIRAVLRGALATAVDRELIQTNPASGFTIRSANLDPKWTYLTPDEIAMVITCDLIPVRFRLLYIVAIYTGMRRGEMWALDWTDLTLDGPRPEVHVQHSHNGPTKSGRSRRVPLFPPAVAALKRLHELAGKPERGLVFVTNKGRRRYRADRGGWGANSTHPGYKVTAGITRRVPFHSLRHTCATALVSGFWGPPWRLEDVQRFLGHASTKMTERYAHFSPEHLHARAMTTATEKAPLPVVITIVPPRVSQGPTPQDTPRQLPAAVGQSSTACSSTMGVTAPVIVGETAPRVSAVSRWLAESVVQRVNLELPIRDTVAELRSSLATHDGPARALAESYDPDGPHRVRAALDLADAVLAMAVAGSVERAVR